MIGKREEHAKFGINETRSKPMRRVTEPENGRNPSRKEISSSWGEPDRRHEEDGEELWSYRNGMALRGAIPMLGIGIPLVTPIGRNFYDFHFTKGSDRAQRLVVESDQLKGGYFGVSSFSDTNVIGFHKLGD